MKTLTILIPTIKRDKTSFEYLSETIKQSFFDYEIKRKKSYF